MSKSSLNKKEALFLSKKAFFKAYIIYISVLFLIALSSAFDNKLFYNIMDKFKWNEVNFLLGFQITFLVLGFLIPIIFPTIYLKKEIFNLKLLLPIIFDIAFSMTASFSLTNFFVANMIGDNTSVFSLALFFVIYFAYAFNLNFELKNIKKKKEVH